MSHVLRHARVGRLSSWLPHKSSVGGIVGLTQKVEVHPGQGDKDGSDQRAGGIHYSRIVLDNLAILTDGYWNFNPSQLYSAEITRKFA
jgi:hypothetical protein